MKEITLTGLIIAIAITAVFSQDVRLRAFDYSLMDREEKRTVVDKDESNVLIMIKPEFYSVEIYSKEQQGFDRISEVTSRYDLDNDYVNSWDALDSNGLRCKLRLTYVNQENHPNNDYDFFIINVIYSDLALQYRAILID